MASLAQRDGQFDPTHMVMVPARAGHHPPPRALDPVPGLGQKGHHAFDVVSLHLDHPVLCGAAGAAVSDWRQPGQMRP
jgi:hypothetical protein